MLYIQRRRALFSSRLKINGKICYAEHWQEIEILNKKAGFDQKELDTGLV